MPPSEKMAVGGAWRNFCGFVGVVGSWSADERPRVRSRRGKTAAAIILYWFARTWFRLRGAARGGCDEIALHSKS